MNAHAEACIAQVNAEINSTDLGRRINRTVESYGANWNRIPVMLLESWTAHSEFAQLPGWLRRVIVDQLLASGQF